MHSQPGATIHLFVGSKMDIPLKRSKKEQAKEEAVAEEPIASVKDSAAPNAAASASNAFPWASLFAGAQGPQGLHRGLPMEQLLGLAKTPQGEALLAQFGLNADSASALLNNLSKNHPVAAAGERPVVRPVVATTAICDECDAPIGPAEVRFHCLDCPDFDLHQSCKLTCLDHDQSHRFETQFASNENVERLVELANVPRELALDVLNQTQGKFEQALEQLLIVQQ